ncbi:uncharacterized protein LOC121711288 [Alosa sapidissima]|uniref:uncharacterized protein LOC121711288 n=1 Tax=Alosa sapidissima TaxID=34773 RepID=UPI001C08F0E8|nr:uncharacterized protein LOC121711288 [Alosa sapidissima]
MLLVDGSYSVGILNFQTIRTFISHVVDIFEIGPDRVQIGLVQYAGAPLTEWHLNTHKTRTELLRAVADLPCRGGNTMTGLALNYILQTNFKASVGMREKSSKMGVLITDGRSQDDIIFSSQNLRDQGIEMYAIGVNSDENELRLIVSDPEENHMYLLKDFNLLINANDIITNICNSVKCPGAQGGNSPTVFSSAGGTATLPCANVLDPNCSSTTWLYGSTGPIDELFGHGKIKPENAKNRSERLSLSNNCSLHITNVTTEDAGLYTCQQFPRVGGQQFEDDAPVYLAVLHVSAFSRETEMEPGSHVTLHCLLHTHDNCTKSVGHKGVSLSWVDQTGSDLSNITHRQIRTTSMCSTTPTVEIRAKHSTSTQRTWRCQLAAGGKVQTTATYTIRGNGTTASTNSGVALIAGVGVSISVLAAAALIIIVVIRKREIHAEGEHTLSQSRTSATALQSVPAVNSSANEEEGADLHYEALQHLNPTPAGPSAKQSEHTVTYSTIMQLSGGEDQSSRPVDPNAVYATVQKKDNTQN